MLKSLKTERKTKEFILSAVKQCKNNEYTIIETHWSMSFFKLIVQMYHKMI